jgi:outer membrane receptor protein involved in Fe transport
MHASTANVPARIRANIRPRAVFVLLMTAALPSAVRAQAVAPAVPPVASRPVATPGKSEVVELTAFEVQADRDNSYGALNSASITRFNVELDKMPVSADIFTDTFMKDVAATSVEDVVMAYSAGVGYSSPIDNGTGTGASNQPGDRVGNAYIQIRGMNTPQMTRDGFMPVGAFGNPGSTGVGRTDNFDIERVEVILGPQSLLYGGGAGAGGAINVTSKMARFGREGLLRSAKGSVLYRIDQHGSKRGELDFGVGNHWFAARLAFLKESARSRRINVGGTTDGQYGQLAFRFFQETLPTTIRISVQQTMNLRRLPRSLTLTAPTTGPRADSRNGQSLRYLLATGQAGATNPVTGAAYGTGAILNGNLHWDNVDSFAAGNMQQDPISNDYSSITIDTKWTSWLTTQVAAGYDDYRERRLNPGASFFAPMSGTNTTNDWVMGVTPQDSWQPADTKGGRIAALVTKDFFNGRAKTQTILGTDFVRTNMAQIDYRWFQADSNWNVIVAPGTTITSANSGRTLVGNLFWPVNNGPVLYPFDDPAKDRATWNGINYVRALLNQPQPNLVTPENPLGLPFTSGNFIRTMILNKGIYGANYTQWFGGRLNTLMGFRQAEAISDRFQHPSGTARWLRVAKSTNFNLGVDFSFNKWLHPYIEYSDSVQPPFLGNASDPLGDPPSSSHGKGGEIGLKFNEAQGKYSGTIKYYHVVDDPSLYNIPGEVRDQISPGGLNGGGGGTNVNVGRLTTGFEILFTANPTRNWRMRFSAAAQDGKIGDAKSYEQKYNDQFYANAARQVTYRNGALVYVNGAAANAAQATVVDATTAGAVPLTIDMLSSPGSVYFTNPDPTSGRIQSGSVGGTILRGVNNAARINANGPILTGEIRLPISQLQLNKTLAGINTPGVIVATREGDKTTNYPEYSANFTSNYVFTGEHWLKGFSLGGTVSMSWNQRAYYYYASPVNAANALTLRRTLYHAPDTQQVNGILGYSRKFGRYTWSTQVNVSNLFNHYNVRIIPNGTTGFNNVQNLNATFYQQPRVYQWTNTVRF